MKRTPFFVFLFLSLIAWSVRAKTNALLIAIDDLNDWVGCMAGHPQALTPNIDRLAKRGMLFTNAHCQGPICGPSRASLLSGYYLHRTGLYQQPGGKAMEKDEKFFHGRMMPQFFSAHGYATWGVGKIAHGYSDKKLFDDYDIVSEEHDDDDLYGRNRVSDNAGSWRGSERGERGGGWG